MMLAVQEKEKGEHLGCGTGKILNCVHGGVKIEDESKNRKKRVYAQTLVLK